MTESVDRMRSEAKRIREACLLAAERQYAAETPWYHWNYWLGIPSTILAAIAGAAAFSRLTNSEFVAGGIAIVVAILSALTTFLDPNKRASTHHTAAKAYETLYHSAGFFYRFESLNDLGDPKDLEKTLSALQAMFLELNKNSVAISGNAYKVAARKIAGNNGEVVRDPGE